jgi:hypothetical protein
MILLHVTGMRAQHLNCELLRGKLILTAGSVCASVVWTERRVAAGGGFRHRSPGERNHDG